MNCAQIDQYLDEMMDGTLGAEELASLEAHCQGCAVCAEKLKVNRQMMRVFAEMAPEMDVPLEAQAAWRGAVKREAGQARRRRTFRYAGGIAAALVVAVVATFALRAPAKNSAEIPLTQSDAGMVMEEAGEEYVASDDAMIEADGAAEANDLNMMSKSAIAFEQAAASDAAFAAPMHELEMLVDDVDRVCEYARDLTAEYEGEIEIQPFDEDGVPCANLYIDLPAANVAEFIAAMRPFDQSGTEPEALDVAGQTSLLLVLKSK